MPVLERPGEERPRRRDPLELAAVVAEPDDERAARRPRASPRAARERPCCRGASRSRGPWARRRGGTRRSARRCPRREAAPARCEDWAGRRVPPRAVRRAPSRGRSARTRSTSTPGGTSWTWSIWPTTSSRTPRMWPEPTKTASALRSDAAPHASSSTLPRIEYSSSEPCAFTPKGAPARRADRGAHQHVIREHEVGREQLLQRGRVHRDVALPLCRRHVLEQDGLEALVAVDHEDRQPGVELRPHDLRPAEVEPLGRGILADHHDLVPRARPLARNRPRVDVRAGSFEQVPVPEKDSHGTSLCAATPDGSTARAGAPRPGSRCAPERPRARRAAPRCS